MKHILFITFTFLSVPHHCNTMEGVFSHLIGTAHRHSLVEFDDLVAMSEPAFSHHLDEGQLLVSSSNSVPPQFEKLKSIVQEQGVRSTTDYHNSSFSDTKPNLNDFPRIVKDLNKAVTDVEEATLMNVIDENNVKAAKLINDAQVILCDYDNNTPSEELEAAPSLIANTLRPIYKMFLHSQIKKEAALVTKGFRSTKDVITYESIVVMQGRLESLYKLTLN